MDHDDQFIDGIFNYCDRWCERCPFTRQCRAFVMEQESFDTSESRDIENQAFWDSMRGVFERTQQMIVQMAQEKGIDLDELDDEELAREQEEKEKRARDSLLVKSAHEYAVRAKEWFENNRSLFLDKEDELNETLMMDLPDEDPEAEARRIVEALDVVQWHQYQIPVKLSRAEQGADDEDMLDDDGVPFPRDADGSAKVVLIAIDRSVAAWGYLRESLSDPEDRMLDFLVELDHLRRATERAFPDARDFVRPGFDTGHSPVV